MQSDEKAKRRAQAEDEQVRRRYDEAAAAVFAVAEVSAAPPAVVEMASMVVGAGGDGEALTRGAALLHPTHDASLAHVSWMSFELGQALFTLSQRWDDLAATVRGSRAR